MTGIVVIFDLDKTIIDVDSDNWGGGRIGCRHLFNQLWNSMMGMVIERIQSSLSVEGMQRKIIYLGDGAGDFCPCLKLKDGDYMMPRKDFRVWELICKNHAFVKAEIHEWSDGKELEQVLINVNDKNSTEEGNNYAAQLFDNCKLQLQTIPTVAQEALAGA